MKRKLIVTTILGLVATGTGAYAFTCRQPANINLGPFLPFTQLLHVATGITPGCNVAGIDGFGQGANAGGGKPKRICADLRAGTDADALGFTGEFGVRETACRKHDSTLNGVNICTTSATRSRQAQTRPCH